VGFGWGEFQDADEEQDYGKAIARNVRSNFFEISGIFFSPPGVSGALYFSHGLFLTPRASATSTEIRNFQKSFTATEPI